MKSIKVKIIKSKPNYWYSVGEIYTVIDEGYYPEYYTYLLDDYCQGKFIEKKDCIII